MGYSGGRDWVLQGYSGVGKEVESSLILTTWPMAVYYQGTQ